MRQLLHRRVPHIVGAYLATSWILLEFTDWAVGQYALSPALTNFVVTTLLLLLPAVAVLAWRHGAPGEDPWTKADAAVIGLNLVAAGGWFLKDTLFNVRRGESRFPDLLPKKYFR